jgi:transcription antitermination factor NusG
MYEKLSFIKLINNRRIKMSNITLRYQDEVEVLSGFYQGFRGTVIECDTLSNIYTVSLFHTDKKIRVFGKNLISNYQRTTKTSI